jgi:DNA-binding NtrC family response regulator/tetratricopeptide (TPR) repeat protein
MEVLLRTSLGHLELRRMALARAKAEFNAALKVARSSRMVGIQALILNNLGMVHNQQNDFGRARASYRRAERLLRSSGEERGLIQIACNQATMAAKTGDAALAWERLEQAAQLLVRYPGKRLEFLVTLARGMVAYLLGDMAAAIEAFRAAIGPGGELGDKQFLTYAALYLAEGEVACGHLWYAWKRLRSASRAATGLGLPVFERMAHSRLFLLETLLGRERVARDSRKRLEAVPRTDVVLLEAWNDLLVAMALQIAGAGKPRLEGSAARSLRHAGGVFRRLGITSGWRLANVALLYDALGRGETHRARSLLKGMESSGESHHHRLLAVMEPLARGEAFFALGELEAAEGALREAAAAIVSRRFLELDARIEYLHARLAERRGDREEARRYLHRSLHTLDLLAKSLPERLRERFLTQPRFQPHADLMARLERPRTPGATADLAGRLGGFQGMVGRSQEMLRVFRTIEQVADHDVPVLIVGETGTGKELVAAAIHRTGPRRNGPFQALHCATLPAELFESELFGCEEGAFTGASEARSGLLDYLAGGTLLLDDVGSLPPACQAKLLRVLESKAFRPLGGLGIRTADVRFIASSSDDLGARAGPGALRADLYYRLRSVEIRVPALRARKEDIPLLARHFLAAHARRLERSAPPLSADALRVLESHSWPGNVRELETLLFRALLKAPPGAALTAEALRELLPGPESSTLVLEDLVAGRDIEELKREIERVHLLRLYRDKGGDFQKMMEALGVKQATLYRRLRQAGIDVRALRRGS